MTTEEELEGQKGVEDDEALDAAAQGTAPTSDDGDEDIEIEEGDEIDVMGEAAGVEVPDGEPLGGPDEMDKRDENRWELDPASAEDLENGEDTVTEPVVTFRADDQPSAGHR